MAGKSNWRDYALISATMTMYFCRIIDDDLILKDDFIPLLTPNPHDVTNLRISNACTTFFPDEMPMSQFNPTWKNSNLPLFVVRFVPLDEWWCDYTLGRSSTTETRLTFASALSYHCLPTSSSPVSHLSLSVGLARWMMIYKPNSGPRLSGS